MSATEHPEHTLSLAEFRENTAGTLDRLKKTGEAETLTLDGEPQAVLISPELYAEMVREVQLSRDVEDMRRSLKEIEEGKFMEANAFFDQLHAELLATNQHSTAGSSE